MEGEYTEEGTLEIIAIGQPPCEPREIARFVTLLLKSNVEIWMSADQYTAILTFLVEVPRRCLKTYAVRSHFLVLTSNLMISQAQFAVRLQNELPDLHFFFLSDVWLDHPHTLHGLQKMFDNCIENSFVPKVMVLCGNFASCPIAHGNNKDIQRYQGCCELVVNTGRETYLIH